MKRSDDRILTTHVGSPKRLCGPRYTPGPLAVMTTRLFRGSFTP